MYPSTKEIIKLLGTGVLLSTALLIPGFGLGVSQIDKQIQLNKRNLEHREWAKFNKNLLKHNLRRMLKEKIIKLGDTNVELTEKGLILYIKDYLKTSAEKKYRWDGIWRILIYDISKFKKPQQDAFRRMLSYARFLKLQKSVYITPFPCDKEISTIKQYFDLFDEVILIEASNIENNRAYKKYFGLV